MRLNISATESSSTTDGSRATLLARVESELLTWNPREFITAFRRLHQNAFSLLHLNVISILDVDGPLPMSRLAEALDVSVASATGIVDRMEKRGLVERRHDEADRRRVLVHPTKRAGAVFERINERRREGLGRLLDRLSDDELQALLVGHRALRAGRTAMAAEQEGRT